MKSSSLDIIEAVKSDLKSSSILEKAEFLNKFFKSFKGGYGEGDKFIGVIVPEQRKVAKTYFKEASIKEIEVLLRDEIHEHRLTSIFMLVYKFEKSKTEPEKEAIVKLYLKNTKFINNWDIVDSSADKILGAFLFNKPKDILYELAHSTDLWEQRTAMISTFYYIKKNQFEDAFKIAKILLNHRHDLIQKAVGWMLKEIGKKNFQAEIDFLKVHYKQMPRTMLRYSIEKFDPELRQEFLKGTV
jgi:3-methyladenine DNA glycosylase AlkD